MANPLKAEQEPASVPIRPKSIGSSFSAGYRLQYATRPNSSLASATSVLRRPSFHPFVQCLKMRHRFAFLYSRPPGTFSLCLPRATRTGSQDNRPTDFQTCPARRVVNYRAIDGRLFRITNYLGNLGAMQVWANSQKTAWINHA